MEENNFHPLSAHVSLYKSVIAFLSETECI